MASRGVGGMNGRVSARLSTPAGKIAGNAFLRRASARRLISAFCSCHVDMRSGPRAASIAPKRKRLFTSGLSGDARQSEAGPALEIGPLEERNVAEMSYEVDV